MYDRRINMIGTAWLVAHIRRVGFQCACRVLQYLCCLARRPCIFPGVYVVSPLATGMELETYSSGSGWSGKAGTLLHGLNEVLICFTRVQL